MEALKEYTLIRKLTQGLWLVTNTAVHENVHSHEKNVSEYLLL